MALMVPLGVNVQSFGREVLDHSRPVVVYFWSTTCGYCVHFNAEFDAAARELGGQVKFAKVLAQEAGPIFGRYQVRTTPSVLLFRGGVEIARRSGYMTKEQLLVWMRQSLQAKAA